MWIKIKGEYAREVPARVLKEYPTYILVEAEGLEGKYRTCIHKTEEIQVISQTQRMYLLELMRSKNA